jgi:hypothetical protein
MEINDAIQNNIASIRQAIGISVLRKSVGQDAQSLAAILKALPATGANAVENSVTPYKGGNIDVRV